MAICGEAVTGVSQRLHARHAGGIDCSAEALLMAFSSVCGTRRCDTRSCCSSHCSARRCRRFCHSCPSPGTGRCGTRSCCSSRCSAYRCRRLAAAVVAVPVAAPIIAAAEVVAAVPVVATPVTVSAARFGSDLRHRGADPRTRQRSGREAHQQLGCVPPGHPRESPRPSVKLTTIHDLSSSAFGANRAFRAPSPGKRCAILHDASPSRIDATLLHGAVRRYPLTGNWQAAGTNAVVLASD